MEWDESKRTIVRSVAAYGMTQDKIAQMLGISESTLKRHCPRELSVGVIEADAKVMETFFKMATSGKYPAATIFHLKARCGWKDRSIVENVGAGGGPIQHDHLHDSQEERDRRLAELAARVNARKAEKKAAAQAA